VVVYVGGDSAIEHRNALEDDPQRRRPDISRAKAHVGWQPKVGEVVVTRTLPHHKRAT